MAVKPTVIRLRKDTETASRMVAVFRREKETDDEDL